MIALSDPLSALYNAGGAKKSGSLRMIKHISSKGKTMSFDLYNLLIEEKILPRIQLETGDIIYIPPVGEVVVGSAARALRIISGISFSGYWRGP